MNAVRRVAKRLAHLKPRAVVPAPIVAYALGHTDHVDAAAADTLREEMERVEKTRAALLALAPAFDTLPDSGGILL